MTLPFASCGRPLGPGGAGDGFAGLTAFLVVLLTALLDELVLEGGDGGFAAFDEAGKVQLLVGGMTLTAAGPRRGPGLATRARGGQAGVEQVVERAPAGLLRSFAGRFAGGFEGAGVQVPGAHRCRAGAVRLGAAQCVSGSQEAATETLPRTARRSGRGDRAVWSVP